MGLQISKIYYIGSCLAIILDQGSDSPYLLQSGSTRLHVFYLENHIGDYYSIFRSRITFDSWIFL